MVLGSSSFHSEAVGSRKISETQILKIHQPWGNKSLGTVSSMKSNCYVKRYCELSNLQSGVEISLEKKNLRDLKILLKFTLQLPCHKPSAWDSEWTQVSLTGPMLTAQQHSSYSSSLCCQLQSPRDSLQGLGRGQLKVFSGPCELLAGLQLVFRSSNSLYYGVSKKKRSWFQIHFSSGI